MVPEPLLFQFGRYGVSLILSRLSFAECSTSSSHVLAGALMPACWSIGSLYMRMKMLVKYGRATTLEPSRLFAASRLPGAIFFFNSSIPGRSSRARMRPLSTQRSRFAELQYMTSTISPAIARVSIVG